MGQCKGITKTGKQCRIHVADGALQYCHYHKDQADGDYKESDGDSTPTLTEKPLPSLPTSSATSSPSKASPRSAPGFIYVFTMQHMLASKPRRKNWLRLAAPTADNMIDYERTRVFLPKHDILLKIGFTTMLPEKRLAQWESQCHHDFVLVTPTMLPDMIYSKRDRVESLVDQLTDLQLGAVYSHYDVKVSAFRTKKAYKTEQSIHSLLRKQYGFGKLYCDGCKDSHGGVHKEWFLVPRKDVKKVFNLINGECVK